VSMCHRLMMIPTHLYGIAPDIAAQTPGTHSCSAASHVTDGLPGVGTIDVVFAQTACRLGTLGKQEHASAHCSHASGIAYKGEL